MMAARFEGGEAESALFARGESINFRKSLNFFRLRRVREGHQAPRGSAAHMGSTCGHFLVPDPSEAV